MKKIKIGLFLFVFVFLSVLKGISQNKSNHLKLHAGPEFPVGDFSNNSNVGWGVYVTDYIGISEPASLLFSVGYATWISKYLSSYKGGVIPVKTGFRIFPVRPFYFQPEVGFAFNTGDWGKGESVLIGSAIGFLFKTKGKGSVDASIKLSRLPGNTWIGVGIGYELRLR